MHVATRTSWEGWPRCLWRTCPPAARRGCARRPPSHGASPVATQVLALRCVFVGDCRALLRGSDRPSRSHAVGLPGRSLRTIPQPSHTPTQPAWHPPPPVWVVSHSLHCGPCSLLQAMPSTPHTSRPVMHAPSMLSPVIGGTATPAGSKTAPSREWEGVACPATALLATGANAHASGGPRVAPSWSACCRLDEWGLRGGWASLVFGQLTLRARAHAAGHGDDRD